MIKWSFSGLKDFTNCPKQYFEVKVSQNFTKAVTSHMMYGTEVHKALEEYARDGTELPLFYQKFKPMVDVLLNIPGARYLEHKMALKEDRKTLCDFTDPEYWVRGIADFLVVDGEIGYVIDYKTGSKKYPDLKQLKLMSLMVFAHFPEVQYVKTGLMFIVHNGFVEETYWRKDTDKLWQDFLPDLQRLALSYQNNVWPATPTPLCKWCPVTTCNFHDSR